MGKLIIINPDVQLRRTEYHWHAMNILVGDIGGTNTRLLFAIINEAGDWTSLNEKNYDSQSFTDFTEVLEKFIAEHHIISPIDAACFAIAGPVKDGTVAVTNLPWVINETQLEKILCTPQVKIINDFLAIAFGITELREEDMVVIQTGTHSDYGVIADAAVIGAGTGLGAAHLTYIDGNYHAFSSEVGHTGFAPENKLQTLLLLWMLKKQSHVSLEMLLSGKGIVNIYQFLMLEQGVSESLHIADEMSKNDPAQVISNHALSGDDELCVETLDLFISIYGAAAGNLALNYYPVNEIYIAGGIAIKIKDKLIAPSFINAFDNKGLLTSGMKKITVKLIVQEKIGLLGAIAKLKSVYL